MSDRVAGYNYNIKLELARAADKRAGGPLADAIRLYRDFRDVQLGYKINDVCRSIGFAPSIPCMDIDVLEVSNCNVRVGMLGFWLWIVQNIPLCCLYLTKGGVPTCWHIQSHSTCRHVGDDYVVGSHCHSGILLV